MNKTVASVLVATVLGFGAVSAFACPGDKGGRMDRVIEKLDLNAEQADQFRAVMETKRESMKSYHEAQRTETLNQLQGILTDDQLQQFEEMTERRFHHRKGRT